jgi:hypothetical protein
MAGGEASGESIEIVAVFSRARPRRVAVLVAGRDKPDESDDKTKCWRASGHYFGRKVGAILEANKLDCIYIYI